MATHTRGEHGPGVLTAILQSTLAQWLLVLSLIFGGCCSNALALEYTARNNPDAGSLITFAQFLLVAIAGLRNRLYVAPFQPANRASLVDEIARALLTARTGTEQTIRVAVHAEKETESNSLAADVAERLRTLSPVSVIRASLSGFRHTPPGGGKDSVSDFDLALLKSNLLEPLSPGGSQKYVTKVYDGSTGRVVPPPRVLPTATRRSILLVDGPALLEDELLPFWDFRVILDGAYKQRDGDLCPTMAIKNAEGKHPRITWSNIVVPIPPLVKLFRLRFRPLQVPLSHWIVQVVLFLVTSLLNNAAFKYSIPMAVHIIFRSGGLVVNLLLGLVLGKRYTSTQIVSVLLVTFGVAMSTLSSLSHKRSKHDSGTMSAATVSYQDQLLGLALLTAALVLSSLMGFAQERTYAMFGRHWEEGMFYLHFLALPMFALPGIGGDLVRQIKIANASPKVDVSLHSLVASAHSFATTSPVFRPGGPLGRHPIGAVDWIMERVMAFPLFAITLPSFYIPLAINVFTQFLCVGGVHRLTSRVSSLTVTLVLVVRKAVSLWISVVLVGGHKGDIWLWGGALAVVAGTVAYSLDRGRPAPKPSKGHKEL
ncbi:golgi uridine diphosphate-N- acetylglucosamine transporter [Ceratobasidium sp. 370]|nr:golgi uridine diphosphate-N- acetylglucosamine transporter [Ceratobasidium sp. 370]